MAGLFCWMYVSKPVFVSPPGAGDSPAVQPAVDHLQGQEQDGEWEPSTADLRDRLDPGQGGLPGDEVVVIGRQSRPAAPVDSRGEMGLGRPKAGGIPDGRGKFFTRLPAERVGKEPMGGVVGNDGTAAVQVRIVRPGPEAVNRDGKAVQADTENENSVSGEPGGDGRLRIASEEPRGPESGGSSDARGDRVGANEAGKEKGEDRPGFPQLGPSFMAEFSEVAGLELGSGEAGGLLDTAMSEGGWDRPR